MLPSVGVKKGKGGGTPATNTVDGILAIIASCSTGTSLPPTMLTNQNQATSLFGTGMLPECSVYDIDVSSNPVVAVPIPTPSVPGTYGTITKAITGGGNAVAGASQPQLHYAVQVTCDVGGTVGTPGMTFSWSVDGGNTVNGPIALGGGTSLVLPGTGVAFTLSGIWNAGDNFSCFTERPLASNADLPGVLASLGNTKLPWEGVLIDCQYSTGTVGLIDAWLAGREGNGQFNFFLINTRFMNEPSPTAELPTVYAAAIAAQTANDTSERGCVGADGGHYTSLITGFTTKMPTSLALAAMAMSLTPQIGQDPAAVENGPVSDFDITSDGNPYDWDEFVYQALDNDRLVTLRTFATGGPAGTYITNANVFIPSTSNIYWLQLLRVLNKACRIAYQVLVRQLSRSVRTVFNATTQAVNIDPRDAQTLQHLIDSPLKSGLSGQVTDVGTDVHTDDDLSAPFAPLNVDVGVESLVYLKKFAVTVSLVKTISAKTGG